MDPGGGDLGGLAADIQRFEGRDELGIEAGGVDLHLAADAVGVDNGAYGDKFRTHEAPPYQNRFCSWDSEKCSWKRSM